jgi:NTE family protein
MKKINLVLSGGGARGFAHIGVIKVLKEKGYEISSISGTSMGALIGGLEAYGKLEAYEKWITSKSLFDIIKLLDINLKHSLQNGFIDLGFLYDKMKENFGDINIEDMQIKFTAVATNLTQQKEIWFQNGSFYDALKGSTAIPGYFKPFITKRGDIIVDGGVLNILPVAPTLGNEADLTIAVDVNSNIYSKYKVNYSSSLLESMWRSFFATKNDIQSLSIDLMMKYIYNLRVYEYQPDILIQIPSSIANTFDFHKHSEIIKIGKKIANKIL